MQSIRFHKNDALITSVESWFKLAPPKKGKWQWVDGRSAKELAKAWFPVGGNPQIPYELNVLLHSVPLTECFEITEGLPEKQIVIDKFKGEPRNADLVLVGRTLAHTTGIIQIEAKTDEPFDVTIAKRLEVGRKVPNSKIPQRIENLCQAILGNSPDKVAEFGELRYQLLVGVASSLAEAKSRHSGFAVFVVHQFLSSKVHPNHLLRNSKDWSRFIHCLPNCAEVEPFSESLFGPIFVPGNGFIPRNIPLYLGKIFRTIEDIAPEDHLSQ